MGDRKFGGNSYSRPPSIKDSESAREDSSRSHFGPRSSTNNSVSPSITSIPTRAQNISPEALAPVLLTGRTVTENGSLNGPLGLTLAPDGHIISANGGDGNLVETTPFGKQVATKLVDSSGSPQGAGALFGLIVVHDSLYFVDDATNNFDLLY